MAKTVLERQQDYCNRRKRTDSERRLSTWLATPAHCALKRLARHHGMTRRAMIEQLLISADDKVLAKLDIDAPEWDRYFGVKA